MSGAQLFETGQFTNKQVVYNGLSSVMGLADRPVERRGTCGNYTYTIRSGADVSKYLEAEGSALPAPRSVGEQEGSELGARTPAALSREPGFVYLQDYKDANEAASIALQAIVRVGKPAALWFSTTSHRLRVCAPTYAGPRSEVNIGVFGPDATVELIEESLADAMARRAPDRIRTTVVERVTAERSVTSETVASPRPAIQVPQFVADPPERPALPPAETPVPQEADAPGPDIYERRVSALSAEREKLDAEIAMVRLLQILAGGRSERLAFMLGDYIDLLKFGEPATNLTRSEAPEMNRLLVDAGKIGDRSPFKRAAKLLIEYAELNEDGWSGDEKHPNARQYLDQAAECRELAELFSGARHRDRQPKAKTAA